jgi:hypothetical protein
VGNGFRAHPAIGHPSTSPWTAVNAGLCDSCRHQKIIKSGRGSVFSMCLRSKTDDRFPKYPRLPVRECRGYEKRG